MVGNGKRYTEAQIIAILKEAEAIPTVGEVVRRHGVPRDVDGDGVGGAPGRGSPPRDGALKTGLS